MSRSTRYNPICGFTTARSEKKDKRIANRRFRRKARQALFHDDEPPARMREVTNVWRFSKDGKQWLGYRPEEIWWHRVMRK